jgi:hypothetical protein
MLFFLKQADPNIHCHPRGTGQMGGGSVRHAGTGTQHYRQNCELVVVSAISGAPLTTGRLR